MAPAVAVIRLATEVIFANPKSKTLA